MLRHLALSALVATTALHTQGPAPQPKTHRLEATPQTVAYGYYWSEAKPVLRIASGDIIDVDTLLTNTPSRLERAGVKPEDVQASLRAIVDTVTDKGPGGHILTGPVYRGGGRAGRRAGGEDPVDRSADRLRLQRLQRISAARTASKRATTVILPLDREHMTSTFAPGHRDPAEAVLRQHGRRAAARGRPGQQQPAGHARRQPGQPRARRRHDAADSGARAGRALRGRRRACRAGGRRSRSDRDRDVAARAAPADRPQGDEAGVAARGNRDRLHQHGHRSRT